MTKILARYIRGYQNHVIGDIQGLEPEAFKELQAKGVIQENIEIKIEDKPKVEEPKKEAKVETPKPEAGKVDVVIPTKKENGDLKKKPRKSRKAKK